MAQSAGQGRARGGFDPSYGSNLSPELAALGGQWDLVREGATTRPNERQTCRLTLSLRPMADQGLLLLLPSSCRKTMPIVASINAWQPMTRHRIDFTDRNGATLMTFFSTADGRFEAVGPDAENYALTEVTLGKPNAPQIDTQAVSSTSLAPNAPEKFAAAATQKATPASIGSIRLADLPGRYAILRDGKDTGCMVTLDRGSVGAGERAILAPACRDHGLVVFDPVSWQLARGRITLTARKGHVTHLDLQPDGTWLKDPSEGKSLSLKKL
ncbi:protease inhibitor Inh/omp19 family protein [Beijerinckia indica]|nr:protease inhibitor Inh/omp19 family protein [Beijerinckia indica]